MPQALRVGVQHLAPPVGNGRVTARKNVETARNDFASGIAGSWLNLR
ncbi:Uncharacterised protein [Vibrio cholerae]|nr:Uncharacterised protein [Vibrio cholerae]CSC43103.1 Uncharacterised protein [Vibrio cholerae]CSD36325.1 Uncharacterised protein [Vibrio cholerae]